MRQKKYLEQNVYEAAKDRIRKIYDLFDSVVVCFSGGKDSCHGDSVVWVQLDGEYMRITCEQLLSKITGEVVVKNSQVFVKPDQDLRILTASSRHQKQAKPIFGKVNYVMYHDLDPGQEMYAITTRCGHQISVTGDHSIMVAQNSSRGLEFVPKEANQVNSSWNLPTICGPDFEGKEIDLPDWMIRLAGLWLADGCFVYNKGVPLFKMIISTGNDPKVIDFLSHIPRTPSRTEVALGIYAEIRSQYDTDKDAADHIYRETGISHYTTMNAIYRGPVRTHEYIKCKVKKNGDAWLCDKHLVSRMKEIGLSGGSHTKKVPSWVYTASKRQVGIFLAGYFDGDGCLHNRGAIASSVSRELLLGIRDLLGRLGISSGWSESSKIGGFKTKTDRLYSLTIGSRDSLERFVESVPTFKSHQPIIDGFRKARVPDYYFKARQVQKVEKSQPEKCRVFDFEVEENHMFVANGVLVHNSLATLHTVREVSQELGKTHVDVLFRDEEIIPDCIVDFVDEYRRKDWVQLNWFAIPLESTKFILGQSVKYIQWDRSRPFFRPVPEWAITLPDGDDRVFSQVDADAFLSQWYKGKTAFVLGIRAAESLTRFRSCVNKLNLNYINKSSSKNVSLCKPIYDWEENDVFKYFYEKEIRYVSLYDHQNLAGRPLRVSTPFHAESAKMIGKLREIDPHFYERCMEFMPEMRIQERYWRDMDRKKLKEEASQSFASMMGYVDENFDDPLVKEKAMIFLEEARRLHINSPSGYPLKYIFTYVLNGNFKRTMIPIRPDDQKPPVLAPDAHVKIRDKAYAKQEIKIASRTGSDS